MGVIGPANRITAVHNAPQGKCLQVTMGDTARWQLSCDAAQLYEQVLVPAMFSPWGHDLLAVAAPVHGERVLDVACGTGLVARLAAEAIGWKGAVIALD